ncbi:lipid IV(A) 3-deoxy-D-manno-octulosonic acid transferase [Kangiella japonica]|uniref:3-deoxy-D-manno-octulosonic acid transferase n=2 Tax=Kangiella japonica TaxID=647384 RepID=A0ABN0SWQ1_9GAMM
MGESIAAKTIIERLLQLKPDLNIVVTTTTPTGAKQIIEGLGSKVTHHYSPCDLPGTIKRFTRRIQPGALVIMETELWPNWLHHLKSRDIPVILANARMSEKSAQKYLKFSTLSQQMMKAFKLVLPVNDKDAQRFIRLGVNPNQCVTTGNIKFDQQFTCNGDESYFHGWEGDSKTLVWLAASTHKGEDEILLKAHQQVLQSLPDAKLIIVPRHPERFDEVSNLVAGLGFTYHRRSQPDAWNEQNQVMVGDSMGELMLAYKLTDIAFVGGSLVPIGGHNMIEPASLGKPVLSGPHVHNFSEVYRELVGQEGAKTVATVGEISEAVISLMVDEQKRQLMGQKAQAVVEHSRGALEKTVNQLEPFL